MLPDRLTHLLTAYVDGELSHRERKAVHRLLQRSPEARELYHQLKGDSNILNLMSRLRPNTDISCQVMQTIAVQGLKPKRLAAKAPPSLLSTVAGLAAAAAVLFMIGTASYLFVSMEQGGKSGTPVVVVKKPGALTTSGSTSTERIVRNETKPPIVEQPKNPIPESIKTPGPEIATTPDKEPKNNINPPSSEPMLPADDSKYRILQPEDVHAVPSSPDLKTKPVFQVVEPNSHFLALRELDQSNRMQELQDKLSKDNAFRLELLCPDTSKALEQLQATFKASGIKFRIDPDAQNRLKQKQKANFALFAEDITPDELARILLKLGEDDKAIAAKNAHDGQFDGKGVLKSLVAADQKELANLLGVSPLRILPPRRQGGTRTESPAAGTKAPERTALVLTHVNLKERARSVSKTVEEILKNRKEARAGSLQLFLVLKNGNG